MRFENPANGSQLRPAVVSVVRCIYFAAKGVWTHAVAALALVIMTTGIS
jgi:hypothetical protein